MFCRYKGKDSQFKTDTVYYLEFSAGGFDGRLNISSSFFRRQYASFEEFIAEWEIV